MPPRALEDPTRKEKRTLQYPVLDVTRRLPATRLRDEN